MLAHHKEHIIIRLPSILTRMVYVVHNNTVRALMMILYSSEHL